MTWSERWEEFKAAWKESRAPRCPACHGTGEPSHRIFREEVMWKGEVVEVCHNCYGKGVV